MLTPDKKAVLAAQHKVSLGTGAKTCVTESADKAVHVDARKKSSAGSAAQGEPRYRCQNVCSGINLSGCAC
eukprot:823035-Pelagomonas_calceolata.AAC.1